jgi:hypothetical protein
MKFKNIGYRAKRIIDNEWAYGYIIDENYMLDSMHCSNCSGGGCTLEETLNCSSAIVEIDPKTICQLVMQYNVDIHSIKFPVDVYEQDVISDGVEFYVVKYSETSCGFHAASLEGNSGSWSLYHLLHGNNKSKEFYVIGNKIDKLKLLNEIKQLKKEVNN